MSACSSPSRQFAPRNTTHVEPELFLMLLVLLSKLLLLMLMQAFPAAWNTFTEPLPSNPSAKQMKPDEHAQAALAPVAGTTTPAATAATATDTRANSLLPTKSPHDRQTMTGA